MAKNQAIGIDIDGQFLKIAIASMSGSRVIIDSLYTAQVNADAPVNMASGLSRKAFGGGDKKDILRKPTRANQDAFWAEISDILEDYLQQVEVKTNFAATAIPQMNTVSREIVFPSTVTDNEIDKSLSTKAKPLLRESLNDMFYDYNITRDANNDKVVNLIAISKSDVLPMLTAFEYGGVHPLVLDIEGRMQYQYFYGAIQSGSGSTDETVLFLDVKISTVNIYIFEDDDMVFFKEIPLVVPQELEAICYQAIISEQLDGLASSISGNHMLDAKTSQYIEALVSSVESELRLYQALHNGNRPERFFVYGTATIVPNMASVLAEQLKLSVGTNDLLRSITPGRMMSRSTYQKAGGYYTSAIHLARRACQGARFV